MTPPRTVVGDRRPPSRGDRQRARIIEAAVELLDSVPLADLPVMRIAKHAGVTRPAFYFYFESKYAVVAAALDEVWAELDAATDELTGYDFQEPPAEFNQRMITHAADVWQRYAPLMRACAQGQESDVQLRDLWNRCLGNLTGKLLSFIDKLRAAGHMRPATSDTAALTHALVGMTAWVLQEQHLQPEAMPPERLLDAVHAIWLAAAWGPGQTTVGNSPESNP